jgi:hypothetical protein
VADFGHLWPALVPGFLHARRNRGGGELVPADEVPVEEHADSVLLVRIAKHVRAAGTVLTALVGALGREIVSKRS